jgi:hypothetical protein
MVSSNNSSRPLHVGLAGQALDCAGKFVECGRVDQVDRKAHRHAHRDGQDREQGPDRVGAPFTQQ